MTATSQTPLNVSTRRELDTICAVAARCFELPRDQIAAASRLVEDLGADSMDILALLDELEKEFSIPIPDEAAHEIHRLSDALLYVHSA